MLLTQTDCLPKYHVMSCRIIQTEKSKELKEEQDAGKENTPGAKEQPTQSDKGSNSVWKHLFFNSFIMFMICQIFF